jgi:hypothetical protein
MLSTPLLTNKRHRLSQYGTLTGVIGAGSAGVYNVARPPQWQRQDYGKAVIRHALAEVHNEHGIERTILQATPAGYQLCQRMGYRPVTKVAVYSS